MQLRVYLEDNDAEVISWRQAFRPGDYPLDALRDVAARADGALLVATADDVVTSRGSERPIPRDNILVELGYFTAILGRHRTALVHVRQSGAPDPKLPTDLDGLTVIVFDPQRKAATERAVHRWLNDIRSAAAARAIASHHLRETVGALEGVRDAWLPFISGTLLLRHSQSLAAVSKGTVELSPSEYYRLIVTEMDDGTSATLVRAVASLSPTRWVHSEDQRGYIERNIAAAGRGVQIRRLFVLPEDVQGSVSEIAARMSEAGIQIRFAKPGPWPAIHKIQDMVMFSDNGPIPSRAYVAYPDSDYPLRIASSEVRIEPAACLERATLFDSLWDWAADLQTKPPEVVLGSTINTAAPPGHAMHKYYLERPVITCREAAAAKQIPLDAELKTLILETSIGPVAVHIPGDKKMNLRAVKTALRCKQARVASREKLSSLGLAPGTVSAVLDPVWYMPQLLCESVLEKETVSTNSGTLTGFFKFRPDVLMRAPKIVTGKFSTA
jgi:prolyl-tRNA editing enzyme YbaK/EbsC (Cys-tRNA(Pro) deacylase)